MSDISQSAELNTPKSASTQPGAVQARSHGVTKRLLLWLTSMNLAVTLLVILAIASVIGTVLKQNESFNSYLDVFGPFWFAVFRNLSLYDVYSATWFVAILLFLVASTSSCVARNAPAFLRDIRSFRLNAQEKSLRAFAHKADMKSTAKPESLVAPIQALLERAGFKSRVKTQPHEILISGRKGGLNRIGYVLTHLGIIVILLGGLLDSKMQLKLMDVLGMVKVETANIPVSEVPAASKIQVGGLQAFRGTVNIPEHKWGDVVFIGLKDGYVVQNLPFKIFVNKFVIEHYDTGMPKSYMSNVTLTNKETGQEITKTIEVNHPLHYMGYNIFQSSFGDGGTKLNMEAWQLSGKAGVAQPIDSAVFDKKRFDFNGQSYQLEFTDFRLYNINPVTNKNGVVQQKNYGPSVTFKLRNAAGEAIEYQNYLLPIDLNGHPYFLSGVTRSIGGQQQFLYIPADQKGSIDTFMAFLSMLSDQARVQQIAAQLIGDVSSSTGGKGGMTNENLTQSASASIAELVHIFVQQGFGAMKTKIESALAQRNLSPEASKKAEQASISVVRSVLERAFLETLAAQDGKREFTDQDAKFFDDAMDAISALPAYGSPIFVQPKSFEQIQSTGLEVSRAPGAIWVTIGSVMLVIGIFMNFYIHYRRQWILLKPEGEGTRILLAGSDIRKNIDFDKDFAVFRNELMAATESKSSERENPA
ncbi:cytochrome c biogenesis protein ResB [Halothiobacillus sp.]|uniref:cytochrome c biogenesis protein ResB n=1 Tax=Halothiobacillus sp. TaxID=1891311 RepID=UPI0026194043|nr:cytochrome c biogenesis protein ResB [Halothiobacillus sp.]